MKNITKKILCILIVFIVCSISFSDLIKIQAADGYKGFTEFDGKESSTGQTSLDNIIINSTGTVMTLARIIAITVAVVMILVCAMKYMIAAPGDRADIKKHIFPYLVGSTIIFAVTGIIGMVAKFADQVLPTPA